MTGWPGGSQGRLAFLIWCTNTYTHFLPCHVENLQRKEIIVWTNSQRDSSVSAAKRLLRR